jgi:predicted metal-dependent HD superfamily phosphohydrolase
MPLLTEQSSALLQQTEYYVRTLLTKKIPAGRTFHHLQHTELVVAQCLQLSAYYKPTPADSEALLAAAWFHDTGYYLGREDHEAESIRIATRFLHESGATTALIAAVEHLISATRLPARPATLLEEMLCDADLYHLSASDYDRWSAMLKAEEEYEQGRTISDKTWNDINVTFFSQHRYFTLYAQTYWNLPKQKNLSGLVGRLITP